MKKLNTIGFTKKSAREFFELLQANSVRVLADIRLNNTSQLAGFTKSPDLEYFLSLVGISYIYWPQVAPTKEIFTRYKDDGDWEAMEKAYRAHIETSGAIDDRILSEVRKGDVCLLCSEAAPEKCHRRLLAEMIRDLVHDVEIRHL